MYFSSIINNIAIFVVDCLLGRRVLRGKELKRLVVNRINDIKIGKKIMIYYFVLLVFSVSISGFVNQKINSNIMSQRISDVSVQTLHSINLSIDSLVDIVNGYSKMLISNDNVQDTLRDVIGYSDIETQRKMYKYISDFIDFNSPIPAIYIFDNAGNKYAVDKYGTKKLKINSIRNASWYDEVTKLQGGYTLKLNAGDIFIKKDDENFVSFIRVINDLNTQNPIGILVINITQDSIVKSYKEISDKYNTGIILKDEADNDIISSANYKEFDLKALLKPSNEDEYNTITKKIDGKSYIATYIENDYKWKIISIMPFDELKKESSIFNLVTIIIIFFNSILLFIGAIFISRLITNPINKLLKSMKGVENGEFKKVHIKTGNDEIGKLKDGYNIMIEEIQTLIDKIIKEQKVKRKAELNVLQEQIKPHFLYNTFDAISALSLSGQNKEVYNVTKALGSYYRTSLSKGSEVISIAKELEIVENYLVIQKVRYGDMFAVEFDVDENVNDYKMLKLTLQPLVENALYHGIKNKGENGVIRVSAKLGDDCVKLVVEDDGIGMEQEDIDKITGDKASDKAFSFGLRGTIERLRIYYGCDDVLSIESVKGCGTKVIITIPTNAKGEFDNVGRYAKNDNS